MSEPTVRFFFSSGSSPLSSSLFIVFDFVKLPNDLRLAISTIASRGCGIVYDHFTTVSTTNSDRDDPGV